MDFVARRSWRNNLINRYERVFLFLDSQLKQWRVGLYADHTYEWVGGLASFPFKGYWLKSEYIEGHMLPYLQEGHVLPYLQASTNED